MVESAYIYMFSVVFCFSFSSLTMGQLYEKEKDEDGFLYVAYSGENTFGF